MKHSPAPKTLPEIKLEMSEQGYSFGGTTYVSQILSDGKERNFYSQRKAELQNFYSAKKLEVALILGHNEVYPILIVS